MQTWDIWYPHAASQGLSFARGRLDPTERLLVHAAPPVLKVEVRDQSDNEVAEGQNLERERWTPITLLERSGKEITRQDIWPDESLYGTPVMLPGGEVGILTSWWNSDAKDEWRWSVEFYNHK